MGLVGLLRHWLGLARWRQDFVEAAAENLKRDAEHTARTTRDIEEEQRRIKAVLKQQRKRIDGHTARIDGINKRTQSNADAIGDLIKATRFGDRR